VFRVTAAGEILPQKSTFSTEAAVGRSSGCSTGGLA
jgi:hypothetical protein